MPIDLPMKELRRNDDAMKTDAGIKKIYSKYQKRRNKNIF
jgi:hypothetical protein